MSNTIANKLVYLIYKEEGEIYHVILGTLQKSKIFPFMVMPRGLVEWNLTLIHQANIDSPGIYLRRYYHGWAVFWWIQSMQSTLLDKSELSIKCIFTQKQSTLFISCKHTIIPELFQWVMWAAHFYFSEIIQFTQIGLGAPALCSHRTQWIPLMQTYCTAL